mmetsp:Transcript_713/g.2171  ORF Transcript_713/g.2171 Transcript_713/m.2171 type:complete len:209 (-) Transcript_713:263-889(-)
MLTCPEVAQMIAEVGFRAIPGRRRLQRFRETCIHSQLSRRGVSSRPRSVRRGIRRQSRPSCVRLKLIFAGWPQLAHARIRLKWRAHLGWWSGVGALALLFGPRQGGALSCTRFEPRSLEFAATNLSLLLILGETHHVLPLRYHGTQSAFLLERHPSDLASLLHCRGQVLKPLQPANALALDLVLPRRIEPLDLLAIELLGLAQFHRSA